MNSCKPKFKVFCVLVAIISMLCTTCCHAIQCNPAEEYLACDKATGKVLACPKCRVCKPGFEPKIPCGVVIGINITIGGCQRCKDGYYSATEDVHSCQICRGSKCSVHEKVAGTCKKDQYDTSFCSGICEDGYLMNNDKTRCENISKFGEKTTKHPAAESSSPETKKQCVLIIVIPIVVCLLLLVTFVLWYRSKCRRREDGKENSVNDGELKTVIDHQEHSQETGSNKFHVEETDHGCANSRQSNNDLSADITSCTAAPQCEQNQETGLPTMNGPHIRETSNGYVNSRQSSDELLT